MSRYTLLATLLVSAFMVGVTACASARSASSEVVSTSQTWVGRTSAASLLPEAPTVAEGLDPSDGNQDGSLSEGLFVSPLITGDVSGASRGDLPAGPALLSGMVQAQRDQVTRQGDISHMGDYPVDRDYLALPCARDGVHCGLTVELCGPAACRVMTQGDYGPSQSVHPDRIADVHPAVFAELCGVGPEMGLCPGSWTVVTRATLPPTDAKDQP